MEVQRAKCRVQNRTVVEALQIETFNENCSEDAERQITLRESASPELYNLAARMKNAQFEAGATWSLSAKLVQRKRLAYWQSVHFKAHSISGKKQIEIPEREKQQKRPNTRASSYLSQSVH